MEKEELLVYMRMENLLNRVYPALKNFPKSEKYALSQDIRRLFLEYLSLIDQASCVKSKRFEFAQEAQGCLNTIKAAFSIAVRQKFISRGFYKEISLELTEVSRLLAGYIRASARKRA